MSHRSVEWVATVYIRGGDGFGDLHNEASSALAELADLGGTVERVSDGYVAHLNVEATDENAARSKIEQEVTDILTPHLQVRAIVVKLE